MSERIGILGTGQMAMMLATLLAANDRPALMLGRSNAVEHLRRHRQSPQMPGVTLPDNIEVTGDCNGLEEVDVLLVAVPTQAVRGALEAIDADPAIAVSCCKGIELASGLRPSEVIAEVLPGGCALATLSGPNIADEVARQKPAGAVVASPSDSAATRVRDLLSTQSFRIYTNSDQIGVELAGATKNIIALAAGIIDGLGLGDNAKASLITRGLVEITRLGTTLGAASDTFAGLAGMGDLITTCISPHGRNRTVGQRIGQGEKLDDVLAHLGSVCEGVPTTKAVLQIAHQHRVEMPITQAVAGVLFEGRDVREVLLDLMTREPKAEG